MKWKRLYVSEDFARLMKAEAALKGKSVPKHTEDIAKEKEDLLNQFKIKKDDKRKWGFDL